MIDELPLIIKEWFLVDCRSPYGERFKFYFDRRIPYYQVYAHNWKEFAYVFSMDRTTDPIHPRLEWYGVCKRYDSVQSECLIIHQIFNSRDEAVAYCENHMRS